MWRTFIGLDGNEWDSHLRCLIGFDRSAPPIQGRKPVPIKSYPILFGAQNTTRHSEAWNKPWESPSFKLKTIMKIATSLAALAMTDIYFSIFGAVYRKISIFVIHIRLIAIELPH